MVPRTAFVRAEHCGAGEAAGRQRLALGVDRQCDTLCIPYPDSDEAGLPLWQCSASPVPQVHASPSLLLCAFTLQKGAYWR